MRRWSIPSGFLLCLVAAGCHREVEMVPLVEQPFYRTDKFFDVQALGKDKAIVVGYGGKVRLTADGGSTWQDGKTGVDQALYAVKMVDDKVGWIAGQDGLILHTTDGGKTWERQTSGAVFKDKDGSEQALYLFGIDALDGERAWAVGDRSILVSTTDGGKTWKARKVPMQMDLTGGQAMVSADPIFYDVQFVDVQHGWIVGEFGKIMYTADGGETWAEQEKSLMEGSEKYFDLLDLPTLYGVFMQNGQEGIAAGLEGHVARTTDGGQRWTYDPISVDADVPLIDPLFSPTVLSDGTGWVVGGAGEVVRRDPGASAWTRAPLGQDVSTWLRGVSFGDPKTGWMVGGFGLIFHTEDGGKTWLPKGYGS